MPFIVIVKGNVKMNQRLSGGIGRERERENNIDSRVREKHTNRVELDEHKKLKNKTDEQNEQGKQTNQNRWGKREYGKKSEREEKAGQSAKAG